MFIRIQESSGIAIYDQVVRQIKYAIADGAIREGELVPSVRELAKTIAINPNTVSRAYQQLQNDKVLENVRGTGLAVKKSAAARCKKERTSLIQLRVRDVFSEAWQSKLAIDELRSLVDEELERLTRKAAP